MNKLAQAGEERIGKICDIGAGMKPDIEIHQDYVVSDEHKGMAL